jgi:hypothetical protein
MSNTNDSSFAKGSYGYDAAFVKKYARHVLELEENNAKVLLCADYQGRVFTSSASGDSGTSYGWLNYDLLSSGMKKKQFNPVAVKKDSGSGPKADSIQFILRKMILLILHIGRCRQSSIR